jgi:anionic cell wall polymer biosynthesis LytR-Cps2A-Psr (LCP) family protein
VLSKDAWFLSMKAWLLPLMVLFVVAGTVVAGGLLFVQPASTISLEAAQPPAWDAVEEVIKAREAAIDSDGTAPFGSDTQINILALGIDSRKEGKEQHCDAIHMVTLDLADWSILITSVPRGTYAPLPPGREYKETDYYVSNACAFGGLDYGVAQIEKIAGIKADYVATVGFSQALGIFRILDLPTTETLQWLRHRQSYAIGDPQRSQNQAVFMKDIALRLLGDDGVSTLFLHILYSLIDTDLDFKTIQALYEAYRASEIAARPDDIALTMKPFYETEEYHFDPNNAEAQIDALVDALEGRLSSEDLSHKTVAELQFELEKYLREALASDDTVVHVYNEQLWRQIEDEDVREELHFRFTEKYVKEVRDTDRDQAIEIVTDYILEKQYYGLDEWEEKGRSLLETLVE